MKKNKKTRVIKTSQFCFFGGVGLCFLAVILIMNFGVIAKGLTVGFVYLFGIVSYLLYFLLFVVGIILLFKEKPLKIKITYRIFAILLIFVSLLMFASQTSVKEYSESTFKIVTQEMFDGYFVKGSRITYDYLKVSGGGILGFIIDKFFHRLGENSPIVFGVIFDVLALAIIITPIAVAKYKKTNGTKDRNKAVTQEQNYYNPEQDIRPVSSNKERIQNYDVVKNASDISDDYRSEIKGGPQVSQQEFYAEQNYFGGSQSYSQGGTFVAAHFYREGSRPTSQEINQTSNMVQVQREQEQPINEVQQMLEDNKARTIEENNYNPNYLNNQQVVNQFIQPVQSQPYQEVQQEPVMPQVHEAAPVNPYANEPIREDPRANYQSIIPDGYVNTPVQPQVAPKPAVSKQPLKWVPPSSDLLEVRDVKDAVEANKAAAEERAVAINKAFQDYGIDASIIDYTIGPGVTRFNVTYGVKTSVRSVRQSVEDIAIRVGGLSARFEAVVEGMTTSGIEIPNAKITTVGFKEVFDALPDVKKHPLSVAFGKNIQGSVVYADLDEFPHALIAGTTGSGKSVFVNSLICTLIMRNSPDTLRMVLIDPKKVEFGKYKEMPHLLCKVINNAIEAKNLFFKLQDEMERRYDLFENSPYGATNIKEYNQDCETHGGEKLPYIVAVIDEYADLVDQCKEIAMPICSIAQKARACGIHILLATQRPSTNVVNGVLKGNLPTHVALSCASTVDSQVVLGEGGAEKLLGKGDMLVQSPLVSRVGVVRLQSCYIDRDEISRLVGYLKAHYVTQYDDKYSDLTDKAEVEGTAFVQSPEFKSSQEGGEEAKYKEIKDWVMSQEYMSISRIQRECGVGFNRAGRFFLRMQEEGIVSRDTDGNKGCPVIMQNKFGDVDDVPVDSSDYTDFGSEHH